MTGAKTIFPKGESLRQAVRWLAETHSYDLALQLKRHVSATTFHPAKRNS